MNKRKKNYIIRKLFFLFWEFVDLISSKENVNDEIKVRKPVKFLKIVSSASQRNKSEIWTSKKSRAYKSKLSATTKQKATGTF